MWICSIIEMIVASFKIEFPLWTLLEVVYGPTAAIEGNRHGCLSGRAMTSPSSVIFHPLSKIIIRSASGSINPRAAVNRRDTEGGGAVYI